MVLFLKMTKRAVQNGLMGSFLVFVLLGVGGCGKGSQPETPAPDVSRGPATAPIARTPTITDDVGDVDEAAGTVVEEGGTDAPPADEETPSPDGGTPRMLEIPEEHRRDLSPGGRLGGMAPLSPDAIVRCYPFAFIANWRGPMNVFVADSCHVPEAQRVSDNADGRAAYSHLRFSPDGDKLFVHKQHFSETAYVAIDLSRDPPVESPLTELAPYVPKSLVWHPDGGSVAFLAYEPGDTSDPWRMPVYFWHGRVPRTGAAFTRGPRVDNVDFLGGIAWRWRWTEPPTLGQILFSQRPPAGGDFSSYEIKAYDLASRRIVSLVNEAGMPVKGRYPSVDAAATKLAFVVEERINPDREYTSGNVKGRVFVCDLEGFVCRSARAVTPGEGLSGSPFWDQHPVWTRDGQRIFYTHQEMVYSEGDRRVAPYNRIYSVKADGTDARRVTEGLPTTREISPAVR